MPTATPRRRPGVRFDAPTPLRQGDLPRMDVAAFVGFAASGPLHVPVVVESVVEFEEIFGGDLVLGEAPDGREQVIAQLPPAVRSFFANGGRRCWIVRVAASTDLVDPVDWRLVRAAQLDRFRLPGVLAVETTGHVSHRPIELVARAPGAWADGVRVTATLIAEALAARLTAGFARAPTWLPLAPPQTLAPGDLVRVTADDGLEGWCFVATTRPAATPPAIEWRRGPDLWWFRTPRTPRPDRPEDAPPAFTRAVYGTGSSAPFLRLLPGEGGATTRVVDGRAVVETDSPRAAALPPGTPLELRGANPPVPPWWLFLADVTPIAWSLTCEVCDHDQAALAAALAQTRPPGAPAPRWTVRWSDPAIPGREIAVEVAPDGATWRARDGRIAAVPAGAILLLYLDDEFVGSLGVGALTAVRWTLRGDVRARADRPETDATARWRADRIALSLHTVDGAREVRVDELGFAPEHPRPWTALPSDLQLFGPRPADDHHAALWADVRRPRLAVAAPGGPPRSLPLGLSFGRPVTCGATLPSGSAIEREGITAAAADAREVSSRPFLDDRLATVAAGRLLDELDRLREAKAPARGLYAALELPEVTLLALPDAAWVGRTLQRPPVPASSEFTWPKQPPQPPPDVGRFRLCHAPPPAPPAALPLPQIASAPDTWRFDQAPADDDPALASDTIALQRRAIYLCAARGDLTVALSAPPELRARGVRCHVAALQRAHGVGDGDLAGPLWTRALGFASLHHPWLFVRESPTAPVRAIAPDGAVLGLVARRSRDRGAWIAPAWEPLDGTLALTPALADAEHLDLLDARINPIVLDPRGRVPLDARTLSDDPDWDQLSVRRLMILLRRAALARGELYVFEPLGGPLRRAVLLGFEVLLGRLFDRGAFAGATPAEAFRVTVLDGDPDDVRLVVELRVAPSQPLRFLTIRLVQRGDSLAVTEERSVHG